MSHPDRENRSVLYIGQTSRWETALTHNAELACGVLLGVLIAQAISPVLAFLASMSVMFTVVGIALIERQRLEWALDQVTITWDMPHQVRRGESALVTLTILNPSTISLWGVEIAVRTPEGLSIEVKRHLPARSQGQVSGLLQCVHYGSGHIWGVELRAYDRMKLISAERHLSSTQSVDVIPGTPRLPWGSVDRNVSLSTSTYAQAVYRQRGQDGDFSELRPYQPGDGIRSVAWRSSARRGQLLTRVVERTTERRYLFALDLSAVMRASIGRDTRVDLALDLLFAWMPKLRGEHVGIVGFDHRLLVDLPIAPQSRTQRSLNDLSRYASRPIDHDCAIDTPDELWSRVMFFLEWSGKAIAQQFSDGLLRDLNEPRLTSSILTTNSYRLDFASAYIHHIDLPVSFPVDPLDKISVHDRLRRFCQTIGVTMNPNLPKGPQELTQGLQAVIDYAQKDRATHVVFLSHSQRLSNHKDLRLLNRWSGDKRALSWVQVGTQERTKPRIFRKLNAPMDYIPLEKSTLEDIDSHIYDTGPWRWNTKSTG